MSLSSMADEDEVAPLLRWHIKYGGRPPLPSLREAIVRALPDLDEETLIDVKLICTELVTNVYQHARTDGELRITRRGGGVICIEVDDNSPRLPLVASGPPHQRRCRGWEVVDALAKEWGVRSIGQGKSVWVELDAAV